MIALGECNAVILVREYFSDFIRFLLQLRWLVRLVPILHVVGVLQDEVIIVVQLPL